MINSGKVGNDSLARASQRGERDAEKGSTIRRNWERHSSLRAKKGEFSSDSLKVKGGGK